MDMSMVTGIQHAMVTAWNIAEDGLGLSQWLLKASQHCSMYRTGPFTFLEQPRATRVHGSCTGMWAVLVGLAPITTATSPDRYHTNEYTHLNVWDPTTFLCGLQHTPAWMTILGHRHTLDIG